MLGDELKDKASCALKSTVTNPPLLQPPDYMKEFVFQCDAGERGMVPLYKMKNEL